MKRITHFFLLVLLMASFLLRSFPLSASQSGPSVSDYAQPGEQVITLAIPLQYRGKIYEIHYFTTSAYTDNRPNLIWIASPEFFARNGIEGLLVTANGEIIVDEDTLREVLTLYRSAFEMYEGRAYDHLGWVDDSFVDDFKAITNNPLFVEQQVKAIFRSREEEVAEAMRGIITSQIESREDIEAFAEETRHYAEQGSEFEEAIDIAIEASRFSNNKRVRELGKEVRKIFSAWRRVTEQGRSFIDVGDEKIEFFNALDILSLSIRLIWMADLQRERAEMLEEYARFASDAGALDEEQLIAVAIVKAEAEDQWVQRSTIILGFVRDTAVDLGIRLTAEAITQKWVQWSWNQFGKRITGHLVAGAASAFFLGFTLGNILYGLDDLYNNFMTGVRADELRRKFRASRLDIEKKAQNSYDGSYKGELAAKYRVAYMLEALAAAQMYRSYSNGVEATVRQNLIAIVNPIAWFKGKEWREAVKELRRIGDETEMQAENEIGHPVAVEALVELALNRIQLGPSARRIHLIDDANPEFSKKGVDEYWWSIDVGHAGKAIWTYCDADKIVNSARWTVTNIQPGMYVVEAFIPPYSDRLPKPYTESARYVIFHAGTESSSVINQAENSGNWVELGRRFFDGSGFEYIQLSDQTGEVSGSRIVIFDAIRLTPLSSDSEALAATVASDIVYDVVVSGEQALLVFDMLNAGMVTWSGASYAFVGASDNPSDAPASETLTGSVPPGDSISWHIRYPVSGPPGIRRLNYQMHHNGAPFGDVVTGYVIVLPEPLKDLEQQIRNQIDEWQRQGEQKAEELMGQLWKAIQEEMERQAQSFIEELLAQCLGSTAMLGLVLAIAHRRRNRL